MKSVQINYDGKVHISKHSFQLGSFDVENLVHSSLGFKENEYQDINAEVTIIVRRKSDVPFITVEEDSEDADG